VLKLRRPLRGFEGVLTLVRSADMYRGMRQKPPRKAETTKESSKMDLMGYNDHQPSRRKE
jgi:hypothetical protein